MACCDVLIVGGGPAGLAAAIALRQDGADILVVDGLRPPIDKPCGEGLMPEAFEALGCLGVHPDSSQGELFHGIAFVSDATQVAADFPVGHGFGLRRTALHHLLLDRAASLGVRFSWDTPVVLRNAQPVAVAGEAVRHRWLIGADGHASRVRSWAGLDRGHPRSRRFGFRAHYRVPLHESATDAARVEVHWGGLGQAYITPVGHGEVCVSAMTRHPGLRLEAILSSISSLHGRFAAQKSITAERGCPTFTRRLPRVAVNRTALIGDASGSADAITGEGLALSFRQANLLAESLRRGSLEFYQAHHSSVLALPRQMSTLLLLLDRMPRLRHRAMSVFAARPALFREFLAVHTGQEPLPRFVLRRGPALGALLMAGKTA